MARIPHVGLSSPFGNRGPDNTSPFNPDTRGIGSGLAMAAEAVSNIGGVAVDALQAEKRQEEAIATANAQVALAAHENETNRVLEEWASEAQSPDYQLENADTDLQGRLDAIEPPDTSGLSPDRKIILDGAIANRKTDVVARGRLVKQKVLGQRGEATFDQMLDQLDPQTGNLEVPIESLYAKADSVADGIAAFVPADTLQNKRRRAHERLSMGRVNTVLKTSESVDQLNALSDELTNGRYRLDQAQVANYLGQIEVKKGQIENKAAVAADKAEANGAKALNKLQEWDATGLQPDPEQVALLVQQTMGTSAEAETRQVLKSMDMNAAARTMPIGQLKAEIDALEKEAVSGTNKDPGWTKRMLTTKQAILADRTKRAQTYPLESIAIEADTHFAPLDFANEMNLAVQLQDRLTSLAGYRSQQGMAGIPMNPFTEQEQTMLVDLMNRGDESSAIKIGIMNALANAAPNPQVFREAMAAVKQNSPLNYAVAEMLVLAPNDKTGTAMAKKLLAGQKIMKDGALPLPSPAAFKAMYAEHMAGTMDPNTDEYANGLIRFQRFYASEATTDMAGELDESLAERAFNLATGGKAEYNGMDVFKPWGMSSDMFEAGAAKAIEAKAKETGLDLRSDTLENRPGYPGQYYVVDLTGFVRTVKGKPIVVNVK
jgi:hypothetical protein